MNDDGAPHNLKQIEVSVGWSSSSPKAELQFLNSTESDQQTTPTRGGPKNGEQSESNEDSTDANYVGNQNSYNPSTNVLGKYSTLLPGSSPPRPRHKIRKRRTIPSPTRNLTSSNAALARNRDIALTDIPSLSSIHMIGETRPDSASPVKLDNETLVDNSINTESLQTPAHSPEFTSDSDFEDMVQLQPVQFKESYYKNRKVLRFVVQNVKVETNGSNTANITKIIEVTDDTATESKIQLRGSWCSTIVNRGDIVHYINRDVNTQNSQKDTTTLPADKIPILHVNDQTNSFLVVNPDILISCTSVAESLNCERQVILRSKVRSPSDLNQNVILGTIKHELIQESFKRDIMRNAGEMQSVLYSVAHQYRLDLGLVGLSVDVAVDKLKELIIVIQKWALTIWGPKSNGKPVFTHIGKKNMKIQLERVIYTEEEIRSPFWGLVGKIDVTAEATDLLDKSTGKRLVGLEIKTGKGFESMTHIAQTILYSILLAERHPYNTQPWCLLYYTETSKTIAVNPAPYEIRSLVQKRNAVAYNMWLLPSSQLPIPESARTNICKWCGRQDSCVLYTAISDNGNTHNISSLTELYETAKESGKLTTKFLQFIQHWQLLLDLEHDPDRQYFDLQDAQWWLRNLEPQLWGPQISIKTVDGYEYTMTRRQARSKNPIASKNSTADGESVKQSQKSVQDIQASQSTPKLSAGDRIIVSSKQYMGTSFGLCLSVSEKELKILLNEPLLMSGKYRVDQDFYVSDYNLALARFNLHNLLNEDKLRSLVVDLAEPEFTTLNSEKFESTVERASNRVLYTADANLNPEDLDFSDEEVIQTRSHSDLNDDQKTALNKVLSAKDYTLILGMPGTGKTTTIAAIVAALVERKKTVLVSAYTNSAVDTIVQKLMSANVECVRFVSGRKDSVHPSVVPVSVSMSPDESDENINWFMKSPVIACTSHGTNNRYFSLRNFDVCILDEASQITLPFCLGPLRLAKTFVLVGDHFQLPPLVRSTLAKDKGLSESLFKILCEAHPSAVIELRRQYRMCADIMSLPNELVYDRRLVCGSEEVANQELNLPQLSLIDKENAYYFCIDPKNHVLFLNTDCLGEKSYETEYSNGGVSNAAEAFAVTSIVRVLEKAGMSLIDLAVISVYRRQLSDIEDMLRDEVDRGLEIITADQAQGRDKGCIIVSLVRANKETRTGELLKDWRRLNVAFTRSKQKLIIVGSGKMMQQADGVSRFYNYIKTRNWVYPAPS